MSNTHSSIYLHIIFSTKGRIEFLTPLMLPRMHTYIGQIINTNGHKTIAVGGTQDHVHILLRYNIMQLIPDLVRLVKSNSSKFYNDKLNLRGGIAWQNGYAVISVSPQNVEGVKSYIQNQAVHHQRRTYEQELTRTMELLGLSREDIERFYNA